MFDLHNIKILLDTLSTVVCDKTGSEILNRKFSYFHVEDDKHMKISSSILIPQLDSSFSNKNNERNFCLSNSFWRGCINISK